MAPTSNRPLCDKVQQQTSQICVTITSAGPPGLGSRCTQPAMGGSGAICLPTSSHFGQIGGEVAGLPCRRILLIVPVVTPALAPTLDKSLKSELSDQEALNLHWVKAHDVRAFAPSKGFQLGVSLEQILSASHWKHPTFTQFYLKDVARADSELFYLGPVVAAQQIHK